MVRGIKRSRAREDFYATICRRKDRFKAGWISNRKVKLDNIRFSIIRSSSKEKSKFDERNLKLKCFSFENASLSDRLK